MEIVKTEDAVKANMIRLAREHRRHCCGPDCVISLYYIQWLLEKANIILSADERKEFI